jgi:hypothetical protein
MEAKGMGGVSGIKICKTCGIPVRVGKTNNWNSDGTMTQRLDPDHRMAILDSNGLGVLFSNIEALLNVPIEKIIIESKARATRAYIQRLTAGPKGTLARIIGLKRLIGMVLELGRVLGYGDAKVTDFNWKRSYLYAEVKYPYSMPLFCGDLKGATEAIRKLAGTVSYEEIGPEHYLISNFQAPFAPELEDRLLPKPKPRKPGNIKHNYCEGCGVPLEISNFKFDPEKGMITYEEAGMRMAILGPQGLEVIFEELEKELGEEIPETIIEAQRLYVTTPAGSFWKSLRRDDFGHWLALFGLGNLASFELDDSSLTARVENPSLPLIIVGTALGFYELMTGKRAGVKWSIAEDGDLSFTITPQ